MPDFEVYRHSPAEIARTNDLLRILPRGRKSVLDVGARDGHFSRLLTNYFESVVALDLKQPQIAYAGIITVAGDINKLNFPDGTFDCVFCAEVLEHIPSVEIACFELMRVARYEVIVGVPFRQDLRIGRTTCPNCKRTSPPWGHVNAFTEERLAELFPGLRIAKKSFVGTNREKTNALSAFLMDLAGNPWGTYTQEEPCIHCGQQLTPPPQLRPLWSRIFSASALLINRLQTQFSKPSGNWIHLVLSKMADVPRKDASRDTSPASLQHPEMRDRL
jgi:hypothetical protein